MFWKVLLRLFVLWWVALRRGVPWLFVPRQRPAYLRKAFEDLGPTYIKLGQIIASSPGLFPARYVAEFQQCLDRVPRFPFETVEHILREELKVPLDSIYKNIEATPLAAASIAQVHGATLHDDSDVVIKVQRPHIRERVEADLWFMRKGAWLGEKFSRDLRLANVVGVIDDFATTIQEELDFTVEGRNMDEFNAIMKRHGEDHRLVAPYVHWDFTTQRLLTMERFHGIKADDVDAARALGIDSEEWLRIGLRGWNLTMMLHGFFHGDVHAGNLMFLPERKQMGFIDFGIVGRFDQEQRTQVMRYVLSFATQDYVELATVMVQMDALEQEVDMDALTADMERVYKPMLEQSLQSLDYGRLLPDVIANSRKHGIRMPREFILILKQLLYFDRYAKLAAPDLNVFTDTYLVDFLFTPAAVECGVNLSQVGALLMAVQQRVQNQTKPQ